MTHKDKTIIIGAGMAGMTCALELQRSGIPYTIISPNIGGRVCYLEKYQMNFGAVFYMKGYTHARKILEPNGKVLGSFFDLECHKQLGRGYGVASGDMLGGTNELATFMNYILRTFKPAYERFKTACETVEMREAMAAEPLIKELFEMPATQMIEREGFPNAAVALVSQFVHACTGSRIASLNALDYLNCALGIVDTATRFTFDPHAMHKRLSEGGEVDLSLATAIKKVEGGWQVSAESGAVYEAPNLVVAAPAHVACALLEPVLGSYEIRSASQLYAYKVKGKIRDDYAHHKLHLFDENIPLINISERKDGAYEVFTCEPMDMGIFFERFTVEHEQGWDHALFTSPSIILDQDLGDGLYRIGDHNALGLEPAAISGVFAANRIAGVSGGSAASAADAHAEADVSQRVLNADGTVAQGLPASYDNITDQGEVLYLDEARRARKEQPWKPMYKNHPDGLGIKNALATNLSARDWNWKAILALFRKIVEGSAFMREPQSLKSKAYKLAMLFEPMESVYSTGTIYNLNVDHEEDMPGARQRHDAERERDGLEAYSVMGSKLKAAAANGQEKCGVMPEVLKEATRRAKIDIDEVVIDDARKVTVPMDLVKKAIMGADYIGAMKTCLCRDGQDCQNYPHDLACLFLNMGGKVVVDHGMAVEMTKEEALEQVDRAAELGLTCQSLWVEIEQLIWGFENNQMDAFLEICFCCPCCCVAFNLSSNATRDVKRRFSPTGWTAVVNHDVCTGCKHCLDDYCPQHAIHYRESDGKMVVDQENCVGCGICRAHCPHDAIAIKQTMPMRESMHDYFREEGRLEIVKGL